MHTPTRLFYVAPDAIHLRLSFEPETNTWRVHASTSSRTREGTIELEQGETYEWLAADEALDVACAALSGALGFL